MAWDLSADGSALILEESWEGGGAARHLPARHGWRACRAIG
jgi:hypothetical protein